MILSSSIPPCIFLWSGGKVEKTVDEVCLCCFTKYFYIKTSLKDMILNYIERYDFEFH